MADRFWNDELPDSVVEALQQWMSDNVQQACKEQLDEVGTVVSCAPGGDIVLKLCGFDDDRPDGMGSALSKDLSIKDAVLEEISEYIGSQPELMDRDGLALMRKTIESLSAYWLEVIDGALATP